MNSKNKILAIAIVLILAAGGYYFYSQKAPERAVLSIVQAVRNKDRDAIERLIDFDSVLGYAFDDIMQERFEGLGMDEETMLKGFASFFKKPFIQVAKERIIQNLTKEKSKPDDAAQPPKESKQESKPPNRRQMLKELTEKIKPGTLKFQSVGQTIKQGNDAFIDITFFDEKISKDFTFTAQMQNTGDAGWRLVRIKNITDYLKESIGGK